MQPPPAVAVSVDENGVRCSKCKRAFDEYKFVVIKGVRRLMTPSAIIYHTKMACIHCGALFTYHEDDKKLEEDAIVILGALHAPPVSK